MTSPSRQQLQLDLLTEGGNAGLWNYSPAPPQFWAESSALRLMRCAAATTLAQWLQALQAGDRQAVQAEIEQACRSQSAFARNVCLQGGDGEDIHLSLRGRWHQGDASAAGQLIGVVERTIPQNLRAELQSLRRDRQQLAHIHSALQASPIALFEQDADLRYRWIFAPRMGLKSESLIGCVASDFLTAHSAMETDTAKRAVMQSGKPARDRFTMQTKDQHTGIFDVYMSPTRGSDGQIDGVVTLSVDLAEAAQREGKLLAAFDKAPVGIALARLPDISFVYVNAYFEQLSGYAKDELIGSTLVTRQLWEPPENGKHFLHALRTDGYVRNLVSAYRRKDGSVGRVLISAERVDIQGETLILGMLHDLSELEAARDQLAFSEARYQLLAAASTEGVALSKDGHVVEVNAQLVALLGVPREEAIGKLRDSGLLEEAAPEPPASKVEPCVPGKHNYLRPDGSVLNLEVSSRMLLHGAAVMQISTLRDVTEKVERERSLRHLQASIAHLMDSNMVGMLVTRADGVILEANDYLLHVLGRSRAALGDGALNWRKITAATSMDISLRMRDMALRSGACPPYEKTFLRPDGTAVHMLVALALLPGAEERALAIALDISEQKKTQAQLLELNAQLEKRTLQAERAEAVKTLFLASVSHELRTPLHTILGYVRLLRRKAEGEEQAQLGIVERSGSDLLRLIDDLLEFNHTLLAPDKLRADYMEMDGFVHSLESMFSAMAEQSGNQFHLQLASVLPVGIVQDEGRLVQILRILVDNACKYTRHGHITLTMDSPSQLDDDGRCRLYFAVQDNGRGIDQADREHIFEPLRRGSNAEDRPGLGLGLAIAAQWIQRMGGKIEVQSQLGVGSCFSFELVLEAFFEVVSRWGELRTLQPTPRQLSRPPGQAELPPLPADELAMLGQLISMGRLGRLATWARELAATRPEMRAVAEQLASHAANAEVDALERLYRRWLS